MGFFDFLKPVTGLLKDAVGPLLSQGASFLTGGSSDLLGTLGVDFLRNAGGALTPLTTRAANLLPTIQTGPLPAVNTPTQEIINRIPFDLRQRVPAHEIDLFVAGKRSVGELAAIFGGPPEQTFALPSPAASLDFFPGIQAQGVSMGFNGFAQTVMSGAPQMLGGAGAIVAGAGARALTGLALARKMIFERTGSLFSAAQLKRMLTVFGPSFVITGGIMTVQEALLVATTPGRRRGRGISAADLRRTKSTLRKVASVRMDLAQACSGVRGRSSGRRSRRGPTIIAQN